MKLKVYLDDVRMTPEGWFRVVRAEDVLTLLRMNLVEEMSLDHDLGEFAFDNISNSLGHPHDGSWLARQIADDVSQGLYSLPKWHVHSANPVGADRMRAILTSLK